MTIDNNTSHPSTATAMTAALEAWPPLPVDQWQDTRQTLHMWLQVLGKLKLELCPYLNQWWEVALQLTARGVSTGLIPFADRSFEIEFDFVDDRLAIRVSDGSGHEFPLQPRSVADFYALLMHGLQSLTIDVAINTMPSEVHDGTPFEHDTAPGAYDGDAVRRWWRIMLGVARVLERFRTPFHGKGSPIHLFWGGFDLNHARFNGRASTAATGKGRIMEYGEDEENFSVGFWPGGQGAGGAVLYAYMSPAPAGVADARILPDAARWEPRLGEFVLKYEDARQQPSPEEAIASFFQSTYEVCAGLAGWDRQALEGHVPALKSARVTTTVTADERA